MKALPAATKLLVIPHKPADFARGVRQREITWSSRLGVAGEGDLNDLLKTQLSENPSNVEAMA